MTYEGLRLKVLEIKRKLFAKYWNRKLSVKDFSILSNNCWGGMISECYGLKKNSPTVGLFFAAADYIEFLSYLDDYIHSELKIIDPSETKWINSDIVRTPKYGTYPVGRLTCERGKIDIFFLHYHSNEEAIVKWNNRCKRINTNKLIVKFNDQNGCKEEDIEKFVKLKYQNKLFFTCKSWANEKEYVDILGDGYQRINQFPKSDSIRASYEPFVDDRRLNLTKRINSL